ncbi:hypothetical protein CNX65_20705 [Actinosynnema pretiosum]|uniref:Uncharacterized protein n=1 Tax=Actinosynnema pretiosum TaxID=42197 RepID=A0A290Z8T9_9PSEU|nr:hypothetical protein CNX65_20705 [Actinosynnema pretiosum]
MAVVSVTMLSNCDPLWRSSEKCVSAVAFTPSPTWPNVSPACRARSTDLPLEELSASTAGIPRTPSAVAPSRWPESLPARSPYAVRRSSAWLRKVSMEFMLMEKPLVPVGPDGAADGGGGGAVRGGEPLGLALEPGSGVLEPGSGLLEPEPPEPWNLATGISGGAWGGGEAGRAQTARSIARSTPSCAFQDS